MLLCTLGLCFNANLCFTHHNYQWRSFRTLSWTRPHNSSTAAADFVLPPQLCDEKRGQPRTLGIVFRDLRVHLVRTMPEFQRTVGNYALCLARRINLAVYDYPWASEIDSRKSTRWYWGYKGEHIFFEISHEERDVPLNRCFRQTPTAFPIRQGFLATMTLVRGIAPLKCFTLQSASYRREPSREALSLTNLSSVKYLRSFTWWRLRYQRYLR